MKKLFYALFMLSFICISVQGEGGDRKMIFTLRSTAFEPGGKIPSVFTCGGTDISPPLVWDHAPEGTKVFALICDDPDAPVGTWVHWGIYKIPGGAKSLGENVKPAEKLKDGTLQGKNDFGRIGYGGPCPPRGKPHRYFFKLYALDESLPVSGGLRKKELLAAMEKHILGKAEFYGIYER